MKLIVALKMSKDLTKKAGDLVKKIGDHSAHLDFETPVYKNQKEKVAEWVQAHTDIIREIERLKLAIQRTNLDTDVTIEIGGKQVTKSLAAWVIRRQGNYPQAESRAYGAQTDRGLQEGSWKDSQGQEHDTKIVRCYDPEARDIKIDQLREEPTIIDTTLETVNAVTDLIEG